MLIRNVYYPVQIIFVAAIAASIKASGDKNVLTPIKLLESGAHVTSIMHLSMSSPTPPSRAYVRICASFAQILCPTGGSFVIVRFKWNVK